MSKELQPRAAPSQPAVYQIRIKGHLGDGWREWFGGMTITLDESGDTLLTGAVVDQAALYGLLRRVRDVGMPLLSVIAIESEDVEKLEISSQNKGEEQ